MVKRSEMIKGCKLIILVYLCTCHFSLAVFACKYNVRETGFIDLGFKPYIFYGYINEEIPEGMRSSFQAISASLLRDCNLEFEMINTDLQKDHPAMNYLSLCNDRSLPRRQNRQKQRIK